MASSQTPKRPHTGPPEGTPPGKKRPPTGPPEATPPRKKPATGSDGAKPNKVDLTPLYDFFDAEMNLWGSKVFSDPSMRRGAFCAFQAQNNLIQFSYYEILVATYYDPDESKLGDDMFEGFQRDLDRKYTALKKFRDFFVKPCVLVDADFAGLPLTQDDFAKAFDGNRYRVTGIHSLKNRLRADAETLQQEQVERLHGRFRSMVSILKLFQCQLKDRRNIDYHTKNDAKKIKEFEWEDKSREKSQAEMDARGKEIGKKFDAYVAMPVDKEPQD